MLGDAVVPKRHIAGLPAPADGEFRAGVVLEQQGQQRVAFFLAEFVDAGGEAVVDEQRFLAGFRVGADHRVADRRVVAAGLLPARQVFRPDAEALQREGVHKVMGGGQAGEQGLQRGRQRGKRRRAAGPQRVAADFRQLARRQHRAQRRGGVEGDVGVPDGVVAQVKGFGVQHHDFRRVRVLRVDRVGVQRAKAGGKVALLARRQGLPTEEQHLVLQPGGAQLGQQRLADWLRQVHVVHFGAQRRAQAGEFQGHAWLLAAWRASGQAEKQ